MDKFEFICLVDDIYDECDTKEEFDGRLKQMREVIEQQYLLKLGFKATMGQLK